MKKKLTQSQRVLLYGGGGVVLLLLIFLFATERQLSKVAAGRPEDQDLMGPLVGYRKPGVKPIPLGPPIWVGMPKKPGTK